jgi:organic radical activating enzyme
MTDLVIDHIFKSVQGEGNLLGRRAIFVRLNGCNLSCSWCFQNTRKETMSSKEAASTIRSLSWAGQGPRINRVVITGGEPTLQDIIPLMTDLSVDKYLIQVETNGTCDNLDFTKWANWWTVAPKPGFFTLKNSWNPNNIQWADEMKFVVTPQLTINDILFYSENFRGEIYLIPQGNKKENVVNAVELQSYLEKEKNIRLGIQAHKVWNIK